MAKRITIQITAYRENEPDKLLSLDEFYDHPDMMGLMRICDGAKRMNFSIHPIEDDPMARLFGQKGVILKLTPMLGVLVATRATAVHEALGHDQTLQRKSSKACVSYVKELLLPQPSLNF